MRERYTLPKFSHLSEETQKNQMLMDKFRDDIESEISSYQRQFNENNPMSVRRSKDIIKLKSIIFNCQVVDLCKSTLKNYLNTELHTGLRIFELLGLNKLESGNSKLKSAVLSVIERYEDKHLLFEMENAIDVQYQLNLLLKNQQTQNSHQDIEALQQRVSSLLKEIEDKDDTIQALEIGNGKKDKTIADLSQRNFELAAKINTLKNPRQTSNEKDKKDPDVRSSQFNSYPGINGFHYH